MYFSPSNLLLVGIALAAASTVAAAPVSFGEAGSSALATLEARSDAQLYIRDDKKAADKKSSDKDKKKKTSKKSKASKSSHFSPKKGKHFKLGDTKAVLGKRLSKSDKGSVWSVSEWAGHKKPGVVLKVFKNKSDFKTAEIDALKAVNLYIADGEIKGTKVIATHKAPGKSLEKILKKQMKNDKGKFEKFLDPLRKNIAQAIADVAKNHGVYQNNISLKHVFVDKDFGNHITITGWGKAVKHGESGFLDDETKILDEVKKLKA